MKRNKGFSLVELMIVVAIVGILAAVAIPKFAELTGPQNKTSDGQVYRYIATQYAGADGKVLNEYKVKSYYNNENHVTLNLADGTQVVISGVYKIQQVKASK